MAPIKVLVVEDQRLLIDALKQLAKLSQNSDIQITATAESEQEAADILQSQHFDVATIDMRLPRTRGGLRDNEAGLRVIKSMHGHPNVPQILAMSGELETPEFIIRAIRNGASGYVLKQGRSIEQLFDAIREVHRGGKVYPPEIVIFAVDGNPSSPRLNDREREVWRLIADGLTNQEIGQRLSISLDTVKRCTSELYSKIDVTSRAQATRKWLEDQYGLTEVDTGQQ